MLANHLYSRRRALEANLLLVEDGQYGEKRPGTPSMAKTVKSALRGVRWGARHRSPTPPCDTFWDSSRGALQRIIGLNALGLQEIWVFQALILVIWQNLPRIVKSPILEPEIPISPVTLGHLNL